MKQNPRPFFTEPTRASYRARIRNAIFCILLGLVVDAMYLIARFPFDIELDVLVYIGAAFKFIGFYIFLRLLMVKWYFSAVIHILPDEKRRNLERRCGWYISGKEWWIL
jgi:hypothetical protein